MKFQGRSIRTKTGSRLSHIRDKRKYELGREPTETQVGEPKFRVIDSRGNSEKICALSTNVANVATGDETVQTTINEVIENPGNPNYVRRNIITKGAVIDTDDGKARVTSRPGQTGIVNAVIVE